MNRIFVALDLPTVAEARDLAGALVNDVAGFKVGLELLSGAGSDAIGVIAGLGKPVFADAKLHDIPNTVGRAASVISSAGARWVSVHASGGSTMIEAAARGMGGSGGVLAVTVLTSFDVADLASIGVGSRLDDQIVLLAHLARNAGAEGLVCSPAEARPLRAGGFDLTLFTPGVRPRGTSPDDQRRVATPEDAIAAGADYLVIGRPITRADDPVRAVREIAASINHSD